MTERDSSIAQYFIATKSTRDCDRASNKKNSLTVERVMTLKKLNERSGNSRVVVGACGTVF